MNKLILSLLLSMLPGIALAHHPLGGLPMETFTQGLLSGVGHPVLGFDHLFFVVAMGICAAWIGRGLVAPLFYIAAMLIGCLMVATGWVLPGVELMVAISLLTVGGLMLRGRLPGGVLIAGLFGLFGLFHGAAFGDAIAGQEAVAGFAVVGGYLIGLGLIQYAIALGAGWASIPGAKRSTTENLVPRFAGAMVAGVGLFLTLEQIETPLVQLISSV